MAGATGSRHKHSLPDLPYDYGALEPHINAQIMQLHHSKHHATYVNNLNATEEKYHEALAKGRCEAPALEAPRVQTEVCFDAGEYLGWLAQASFTLLEIIGPHEST